VPRLEPAERFSTVMSREACTGDVLLSIRGLSKRFGGTQALDDVALTLEAGELHALLGENGAGKSTLIKILAGLYAPDSGVVVGPYGLATPLRSVPGVAFVHQDLGLVPTMTVTENIALGTGFTRRGGLIDWSAANRSACEALAVMGCTIPPSYLVGRLPAAEKSMVAIARAVAVKACLLVLDEPTATLPEHEVAGLHRVLDRLRQEGLAILYVTHRLDEVFRFADRATVLRDGRVQITEPVERLKPQEVMRQILGRDLHRLFAKGVRRLGNTVFEVRDLCSTYAGPASFSVAQGEVVALVGLRGSGHDVVGRMLFGDIVPSSGDILIDGRSLELEAPADAIAAGIGFVSSKRVEESICMGLSLRENLFVHPGTAGIRHIGTRDETVRSRAALTSFDVRPPQPERVIATLSGGNQQKVVLARWLLVGRRVLILEEPTIGVDVGAKAEIYRLLEEALSSGLAVVLISSDFEEVVGLSDRALVFDRGRQAAEILSRDLSVSRVAAVSSGRPQ
jgi:ribose transport system ATP-binding protein